jgi:hypothetical protein
LANLNQVSKDNMAHGFEKKSNLIFYIKNSLKIQYNLSKTIFDVILCIHKNLQKHHLQIFMIDI